MKDGHIFGLATDKRLIYLTTVEMKEKLKLTEDPIADTYWENETSYCFGYELYKSRSLLQRKIACASLKNQLHSLFTFCKVVNSFMLNYEDQCFYPSIRLIKDKAINEIILERQLIDIVSKIDIFHTLLKLTSNTQGFNVDVISCQTKAIINQFFITPVHFNNFHPLYDFEVSVYKSLNEICNFLKLAQKHIVLPEIEILQNYVENVKSNNEEQNTNDNLHPFIVIEGLDGIGKSTLGQNLAKQINGELFHTPPTSIVPYRDLFRKQCEPLCRAFFFLGNYIMAEEIKKQRKISPVVLDRYYFTSVAFAIAIQTGRYGESIGVPDGNHEIYDWPKDLMKPSIVILLSLSEEQRQRRLDNRGEQTTEEKLVSKSTLSQRIRKVYESMKGPCVVTIDASKSKKEVCANVSNVLKQRGLLKESL